MNHIINYSVILISLVLGIQFFRGKWLFLIAGFNMSSSEEKAKINIPIMSKIIGSFSLTVGLLEFIDFFLPEDNIVTTSLIFLSLIITVILVNVFAKKN